MDQFNEAKLRGIDMRKLRQESFTSRQHLRMVAEHELRVEQFKRSNVKSFRPETRPVVKQKTTNVQQIVEKRVSSARNVSNEYRFTPEQMRIAMSVLDKKEK